MNAVVQLTPYSLSDLQVLISSDMNLSKVKRRDVSWALSGLAKVLGLPLASIPARAEHLRTEINKRTPAMAGMLPGRWRNIRTLTQFALAHAGLAKVPGRYRVKPSEEWAALLRKLAYGDAYRLGHFARYCTVEEVAPHQVDDAVMMGFLADLQHSSLAAEPERMQREACVVWNRATAAHPDWPRRLLTIANRRNTYAVPWDSFPDPLQKDVANWLVHLAGKDFTCKAGFKPLRATSIDTRKKMLHLYLSALVIEGVKQAELQCLADAVTPDRVVVGLGFFWKRADSKASVHGSQIAATVMAIARHWAKLDSVGMAELKQLCRKITPAASGMTERNRKKLRPLDDPERVQELLKLPSRIRKEVEKAEAPTHSLAIRLQTAVMLELLLTSQIRIRNLSNVKIGEHLLIGRQGEMDLAIPGPQVKNGMPVEVRLPEASASLFKLYIEAYRPLLTTADSPWLFPGRTPKAPKTMDGLREQLKVCLRERCGLDFTPHTLRHAVGKIVLDHNPGAHGQVQLMLGHKRISTTIAFYTGMESKAAMAHWDKFLTETREEQVKLPLRGRRRARR